VDPLWAKTLAYAEQAKKWAPEDTTISVDAIADGKHDKSKAKSHLTGWEKGKPVYDTVQIEPPIEAGKPSAKGKTEMSDATNMGAQLMRMDAPVRRSDGQLLHGKRWTTFDVAESKGPMDVSVRVWVDPATGIIYQSESKVHGMLMFDLLLTTLYAAHPQAGSLPERLEFKMKVLVPFTDAKVNIVSNMDHWIARPK
ncbi:MAG: hypothetical protein QFF03_25160, partial [Pseudomonadota bacterium]|nr:hypothetical protein [Pseudomonadota bacterium]